MLVREMSQTYESKPRGTLKLAILSSHRTSAPVIFSQRSKPALPKIHTADPLRDDKLSSIDLDIPNLTLQTSSCESIIPADSAGPFSHKSHSLDSEMAVSITTILPPSIWDRFSEGEHSRSLFSSSPRLSNRRVDELSFEAFPSRPESSYSQFSSYDSEGSVTSLTQLPQTSLALDSRRLLVNESSSSSANFPTVTNLNTDRVGSSELLELEGQPERIMSVTGSQLSMSSPQHRVALAPKHSLSLSKLHTTISTSVVNLFPLDREPIESTQSELCTNNLASKSTQNLFRHSQSMPLKRRFSSFDFKRNDETSSVWKPQLEKSEMAICSNHSGEIPEEEMELVQEARLEKTPDHLESLPDQESSVDIPESSVEYDLPLLIQGTEIKIPSIRVLKPKRQLSSTPHHQEDTSIHHFCLSSNNDQGQDPLSSYRTDLPSYLEGKRYHRRPKFLYPLWFPSSPKFSVNRATLKDTLYPLYDPSSIIENNKFNQGYLQERLFPFMRTKKDDLVFDASLERAVKHEFRSLNDIPSTVEKGDVKLKRVVSQPNFVDICEDFTFPRIESLQTFDQIQVQKEFIRQQLLDTQPDPIFEDGNNIPRHRSVSYLSPPFPTTGKFRRHSSQMEFVERQITNSVPLIDSDQMETYTLVIDELSSALLKNRTNPTRTALLACQKGILLRLTGQLTQSHESLTRSIESEPGYGEPYWHRSLIYYVNGMDRSALMDLETLLLLNPKHAQAYKLRGEIYNALDLLKNAMQDYSEAISLNPNDTQALLMRSDLYQKYGDLPLAMEDLKRIVVLDKSNIDVLYRTAHYQFDKQMYQSARDTVSTLLQLEPRNVNALCLRGKCLFMLQAYHESLKDFSAAIHYDPTCFLAFFHRGCILRKANAWQAVREFSTAIVLDSNDDNTVSLLHRAIVYRTLKLYEEAFFDFSTYVKLNPDLSIGHTLLGLMYLKHRKDFHRAVHHFTLSIRLEPTNAKTYACRADTYFILSNLKLALLDYSRASHLAPDDINYHILRGKVLLHMDSLVLAKKHLHYSRTLQSISSPTKSTGGASLLQHVVVENFLGNHNAALRLLEKSRSAPTYNTCILFGKTHMKLKNYQSALENFTIARRLVQTSSDPEPDNKKLANVLFLQGLCEYSLGRNVRAIETLTESLILHPQSYEAYYFRGLASIKSPHNKKGILDLNKSLAINAKFFQAYLARASYYFMEGRISKAILNCNEAIDLENNSIRAYFYRGTLKYFIQLYPSAIQDLTHTISLDPCSYLAYYNRAACYNAIGSYYEAIKDYTISLVLFDSYDHSTDSDVDYIIDAKIVQNRGLIYFNLEDYFNALCDFKHVSAQLASRRKLTKSLAFPLHQAISISLHRLGQVNQAVNSMNLALELDQASINGFIGRGNIYMDYMNIAGLQLAKNDYCRALHLDPTSSIARVNMAFLLQFEGKFAQAWRHLTNALETDPYNPYVLEARAIICLQMQDMLAATIDIDRALKIQKTPKFLNSAGIIYFYSKFPKQAMELFTAATKLDPSYQIAVFNAGTLLLINRLYIESEQTFSKGIAPEMKIDEHILINRSVARLLMGRKEESLEDLSSAEEANPNFSHIHVNKAYHHLVEKQPEKATECYQQALSIGCNNHNLVRQLVEDIKDSW